MSQAKAWIGERSVAIFAGTVHPTGEPTMEERMDQVGTGLLLDIAGEHFLVTAAHVADLTTARRRVLALGPRAGHGLPFAIRETRVCASRVVRGSREYDRIDVAVLTLPSEVSDSIRQSCRFLHIHDLDLGYRPQEDDMLGAVGFPHAEPWSRTLHGPEIHYRDVLIGVPPMIPFPPKLARIAGNDALFLRYSPKQMVHRTGAVGAPDPHGFSGSGIWLMKRGSFSRRPWRPDQMRLVGLVHEQKPRYACLIGSRIEHALRLALQLRPKLAPALKLVRPSA